MHAQLFFGNTVSTVTTNKWNPCPRLVSSSVFSCGPADGVARGRAPYGEHWLPGVTLDR